MCGKEIIVEILNSYYGSTSLLKYSESDDEIRFQVPTPIRDTQTAVFRSRATVLNELAVSHRLSLLVGHGKYGVPEDFAFAIKSVETAVHSIDVVDECNVSLRFEVITKRHDHYGSQINSCHKIWRLRRLPPPAGMSSTVF